MNTWERAGAIIAVVIFAFGIGSGWNALNNRIDKVDEKIGAIQKTLGSTACTAILQRQIEAIEKSKADAREALEGLSTQYDCVPSRNAYFPANLQDMKIRNITAEDVAKLSAQLNAVDVQLYNGAKKSNASGARR